LAAVGLAGHRITAPCVVHLERAVVQFQGRIGKGGRQSAAPRIAPVSPGLGLSVIENILGEAAAGGRIAQHILPQGLLGIEGQSHGSGNLAQGIGRVVQAFRTETHQPRQGAAGEQILGQFQVTFIGQYPYRITLGISGGGSGIQGLGGRTHHQLLAGTDKHVHSPVGIHHRGGPHQLVQLTDQLIPFIQQIIGGLVGRRLGNDDLLIQLGDLGSVGIDGTHRVLQLGIYPVVETLQLGLQALEPGCQGLGPRSHGLAGRHQRSIAGHLLHGGKQAAQGGRQPGGAVRQGIVDLGDLPVIGGILASRCLELIDLIGDIAAVYPGDCGHRGALANEAGAGSNRVRRGLPDALPGVTGRAGIGNVVGGGTQGHLGGIDPGHPDIEHSYGHGLPQSAP